MLSSQGPQMTISTMLAGFQISQCLFVVARLGIADLLQEGPKTVGELATSTGAHARALSKVLMVLVDLDVLTKDNQDRFALTSIGALLGTGVAGSMYNRAMLRSLECLWQSWGNLLHTVQTGEIAFHNIYRMNFYQYLSQNPEVASIFDRDMSSSSQLVTSMVNEYDFSSFNTIVDVGGGSGTLMAAVLKANQHMQGILYETEAVAEAGARYLASIGLTERCAVIAGDFFHAVPAQGDLYILKEIVHNWDDERAITILHNCRNAMANHGKVLLIENVLSSDRSSPEIRLLDVAMMLLVGGGERTESEYRTLLASSDLQLTRIIPTQTGMSFIEGVPT